MYVERATSPVIERVLFFERDRLRSDGGTRRRPRPEGGFTSIFIDIYLYLSVIIDKYQNISLSGIVTRNKNAMYLLTKQTCVQWRRPRPSRATPAGSSCAQGLLSAP
jgi:hypothetical protein